MHEEFVDFIKACRKRSGLSIAAYAKAAGVDRCTLNKIELGQRKMTIETLEKLLAVVGLRLAIAKKKEGDDGKIHR